MQVSYQIFQANKQLFERLILISQSAAKKSLASGQQRAEKKGKGVRFHSWNFRLSSHPKLLCAVLPRGPHKHVHLIPKFLTCAWDLSHTHALHLHWAILRVFLWVSTYPRWSVLNPSTGHFLLVDDVHQFDGVVALHVNHRPLQGILSNLVELKRRRRKTTRETQASCFLTKLDRFCNFDMKAVVFKRDLLCTAEVLNNAVRLCITPHLQVFLWPCMSTDAPATFFLQRAANQNKAG